MAAPPAIAPALAESDRGWLLLDIRPRAERWGELGVVPGSVGVPETICTDHGDAPFDAQTSSLLEVFATLGLGDATTKRLALICAGGHRAQHLAQRWQAARTTPIAHLEGGVLGWAASGLPLIRRPLPLSLGDEALHGLRRAVLSCFVAEHAERALDQVPAVPDPLAALSHPATLPHGALEAFLRTLDRAAFLSREQGVASARIAENVVHLLTPTA